MRFNHFYLILVSRSMKSKNPLFDLHVGNIELEISFNFAHRSKVVVYNFKQI